MSMSEPAGSTEKTATRPGTGEEQPSLFQGGPLDPSNSEPDGGILGATPKANAKPTATPQPEASELPPETSPSMPSSDEMKLQAKLDQQEQVIRQLLERTPGQPVDAPVTGEAATIDLGDPPDAVTDPRGFKTWVEGIEGKLNRRIDQEVQAGRSEITEENFRTALWDNFQSKHAELASDPELVRAVFQLELGKVDGAIPRDPEGAKKFLDDLAARLRKAGGGTSTPSPPDPKNTQEEPNRTAGVSSGSTVTVKKTEPSEEADVTPFSEQLYKHQPREFF